MNLSENIDCIGHAGGYSSYSFTRLGYNTVVITILGKDSSSEDIIQNFEDDGITPFIPMRDPFGTT